MKKISMHLKMFTNLKTGHMFCGFEKKIGFEGKSTQNLERKMYADLKKFTYLRKNRKEKMKTGLSILALHLMHNKDEEKVTRRSR